MPILHTFKQTVLDLGRGEAKTKARPLTVADETLDRSAAGMDNRSSERAVLFWLLSDRALFVVVGADSGDHAFRVPYEALTEVTLDFDDTADFLPWYIRVSIASDGDGEITRLDPGNAPGQPLGALPPVVVDDSERARLARGEVIPLSGFAACSRKFRGALERRMELAGSRLSITGADAADAKTIGTRRRAR
ncbi:MAG: hypothetical protein ACR2N7_04960 [Acidimicrobiia bacterium]